MKKIILLILVLVSCDLFAQAGWVKRYQVQGYYTEHSKADSIGQNVIVLNSLKAILLDSTGHYLGSIAHPIYIQPHDSVAVKYEKPTYQAIIAGTAAQATGVRQDTLLAVVKNLRTALANLTNGTLLTTPYLKHNTIIDSIAHTGGARVDTVWFHPAGLYGIIYLFFAGRSDKPDTLSVAFRSAASRLVWGSNAVYLTDQADKSIPSDITTLIVPQSLHKRYLISVVNCEWVRVYRKTTNSVNRVKTVLVGLEENNL